ncbi:dioxygenase [Mycobacterium sp.]|uniref:dioxygenase n=1 Tax=Mycobacterium sp. TaxID=1785 RepID=UPI003D0BE97A
MAPFFESGAFRPLPISRTYSLHDAPAAYRAVTTTPSAASRSGPDHLTAQKGTAVSSDLNEHTITEAVQRTFDDATDDRFREVLVSLVQHLHDFARDVRLTGEEWFTAMDFLERVGKISTPTRQEVMLLSDILGFSMLLDRINQHSGSSVTSSALLGCAMSPVPRRTGRQSANRS